MGTMLTGPDKCQDPTLPKLERVFVNRGYLALYLIIEQLNRASDEV